MKNGKQLILVVDDDPFMRHVLGSMLERLGYEVIFAASGEEGLRLYKEHQHDIDLILSDVQCKGKGSHIDGPKMLELIAMSGEQRPPAIFMTGDPGNEHSYAKLVKLSGNPVLIKAFTPQELVSAIHAVLPAKASTLMAS